MRRGRARTPLHALIERVERSALEEARAIASTLGIGVLLAASLLPVACIAIGL